MKTDCRKEAGVAEAITATATYLAEIVGEKIANALTDAVCKGLIAQPYMTDGKLVPQPMH